MADIRQLSEFYSAQYVAPIPEMLETHACDIQREVFTSGVVRHRELHY